MSSEKPNETTPSSPRRSRRDTFKLLGGLFGVPVGVGALVYGADRSYSDSDGDGIPDSLERSVSFHQLIENTFGATQFDGLNPRRKDLLLDVRYIGTASISDRTKEQIEQLFRKNQIYLQWLDYPIRYDQTWFESEYGYNVKRILTSPRSFYHTHIEHELKDVALQLFVVPEQTTSDSQLHLDSFLARFQDRNNGFSGMSVGNRAVVTEQSRFEREIRLILHEIGHLALCHDIDPGNTGVMNTDTDRSEINLIESEWETLRSNLSNIRNTTEIDITLRRCIWEEFARGVVV